MGANLISAPATAPSTMRARAVASRRPWTSQSTLNLIDERNAHRQAQDYDKEKAVSKARWKAGRKDKQHLIEHALVGGRWEGVRTLRKPAARTHSGVRNLDGHVKNAAERPDILAD
eukprot:733227-Pyramimonas_sp.AAC.1